MAGSKLQYAIQALIEVEKHSTDESVNTNEIADATGLSKRYLEQVFGLLKRAGIVRSSRGKYGGYKIERSPDNLSIERIWHAVGEDIAISVSRPEREAFSSEAEFEIQKGLYDAVVRYLGSLTLRDMIEIENSENEMFYI